MANLHPLPVRRWAAVVLGLSTLALGLAVAAEPSTPAGGPEVASPRGAGVLPLPLPPVALIPVGAPGAIGAGVTADDGSPIPLNMMCRLLKTGLVPISPLASPNGTFEFLSSFFTSSVNAAH